MHIIRTFLLVSIISLVAQAQIITSEPEFATENDSIVIYFDATQGTGGLNNFDGDVYAHAGLITEYSTMPSDWRYVKTPWPGNGNYAQANTAANKLTRVSPNYYKLVVGYPREYYHIHWETGDTLPASEKIKKLAFVFRNADGSKQGKDIGSADIFYTLFEPGINALLLKPQVDLSFGEPERSPLFLKAGGELPIVATAANVGSVTDSILLNVNGQRMFSTAGDTLRYTYLVAADDPGMKRIDIIAKAQSGLSDTAAIAVIADPHVQDAPVPGGFDEGIHVQDLTTVTLVLFAPYKEHVYVLGDFNNWMVEDSFLMHRDSVDADTVRYWLTIENLNPDSLYGFQYLVDGQLRIADPYSELLLDASNDRHIPPETFPGLKPYPAGKTEHMVSTFQTRPLEYVWQTKGYTRPAEKDLIIYELLIRDFVEQHNYQTLIDSLDYLQNLGITAIELMPVNEFDGNESWGYNPAFYFAPDKYYGTKNDLKAFIDACHSRGIAVILDMVLNHATGQSPFVRLYNEGDYGPPTAQNPWLNTSATHPFSVFNDFNHESKLTQKLVDRVNAFWINEYHVDGFRFDLSKGFTQKYSGSDVGLWGARDASRIAILKRMADRIREVDPDTYIILEHFADNSEETELAAYGMMLWGNLNYNYNEATMGYHDNGKSDFSWGYYKKRGWSQPNLVTYMESHDEERLMYKNLTYGNSSGSYNVTDLATALSRIKLAAAFFLTIPGPRMIWQFGELGYDYSIDYNGRVGDKPIRWDYFQNTERRNLYKVFAALTKLRREHIVFRSPQTTVTQVLSGASKRLNLSHDSLNVTIIGNFGVTTQSIKPYFQHTGMWYDYFSGDSTVVDDPQAALSLDAGSFYIFTDKLLDTPEPGLLDAINERATMNPDEFGLLQNYPNPFNPTTLIEYTVPAAADVSLKIFDVLGREVTTLVKTKQSAGRYRAAWNGRNSSGQKVASGLYFYQLSNGRQVRTKKMILLE